TPVYKPTVAAVFNFTKLAKRFGWERISARPGFFKPGTSTANAAEWWHFQWNQGLTVGVSTFGAELLRTYTLVQCQKLPQWNSVKDAVFGKSWF
ncbi:MAG: hypothetical protein WC824_11840, partial [Bacteroidota bacterium]